MIKTTLKKINHFLTWSIQLTWKNKQIPYKLHFMIKINLIMVEGVH